MFSPLGPIAPRGVRALMNEDCRDSKRACRELIIIK